MADKSENKASSESQSQFIWDFIQEIIRSPVNLVLVGIIALLVYKIIKSKTKSNRPVQETPRLPKLRRDFTVKELKPFDGTGSDGRVLIAVNGSVYDVTRGKNFYGPGGPYAAFAGRDASRCLGTFSMDPSTDEYDDLSDLDVDSMNSIKEWEEQFKEKYDYVGKLLKPGEAPTSYSDEEDEASQQDTQQEFNQPKDNQQDGKEKSKDD